MLIRTPSPAGHERPVTCVVTRRSVDRLEPFVRDHVERLPTKVEVLYGGWPYLYTSEHRPLIPACEHACNRLMRKAFGVNPERTYSVKLHRPPGHDAALRRFLLRRHVRGVLAEYGPTGVAVMDACAQAGVPLIVHFFGYDVYSRETLEWIGERYGELFATAAAIVACSDDMRARLVELGAPEVKVHSNACGVDVERLTGCHPDRVPPIFLAVGRFVDKKAPHLTLLAFREVARRHPDARLVMIGDGPLLEVCQQLTRVLRLSDRVSFLGRQPHAELLSAYRASRAFVQHSVRASHGDSEGMPVAILEASASGLPIVATRHAGIRDAVVDGTTGLLVHEADVDGMADAMLRLAADASLAGRMGAAGARHVRSHYSIDRTIDRLWAIVRRAMAWEG